MISTHSFFLVVVISMEESSSEVVVQFAPLEKGVSKTTVAGRELAVREFNKYCELGRMKDLIPEWKMNYATSIYGGLLELI